MGATEYRQGPNMGALICAVICLLAGLLTIAGIRAQHEYAYDPTLIQSIAFGTFILTVFFLMIAFSRYRFSHLRKTSHHKHSDHYRNYKGRHHAGRHHHKGHHHSHHGH